MTKILLTEWTMGEECTLDDCPPGLFLFQGNIHCKSEYGSDAYCGDSGEFFWGGAESHQERHALKVIPLEPRTTADLRPGLPQALAKSHEKAIRAVEIFEDALRHLQLEIPGEPVSWQVDGNTHYQTVSDFVEYVMAKARTT